MVIKDDVIKNIDELINEKRGRKLNNYHTGYINGLIWCRYLITGEKPMFRFTRRGEKMAQNNQHIVDFTLCGTCEYRDKTEDEYPCWNCLNEVINTDSRRPVYYKEIKPLDKGGY